MSPFPLHEKLYRKESILDTIERYRQWIEENHLADGMSLPTAFQFLEIDPEALLAERRQMIAQIHHLHPDMLVALAQKED